MLFWGSDEAFCHCIQGENILQLRAAIFRRQTTAAGSRECWGGCNWYPKMEVSNLTFLLGSQAAKPCCCLFGQITRAEELLPVQKCSNKIVVNYKNKEYLQQIWSVHHMLGRLQRFCWRGGHSGIFAHNMKRSTLRELYCGKTLKIGISQAIFKKDFEYSL